MNRDTPYSLSVATGLDEPDSIEHLRAKLATKLGVAPDELPPAVLRKRSLDARGGRVRFHHTFEIGAETDAPPRPPLCETSGEPVAIVGGGPAGLFCAYELARHGIASTIVERGKEVQPRRRDLRALNQEGRVDTDSNYCFGEGGAGTFSDGKLYTRSNKRGDQSDILEILVEHGAPQAIRIDARPHIGSNRLPKVVQSLRAGLEAVGVKFLFGHRVSGLQTVDDGAQRRVSGLRFSDGATLDASRVVLATGHSARDVYRMLLEQRVTMVAKSFAVGLRIEHPQPSINRIQYGAAAGHARLPAATYHLTSVRDGSNVYSFCMCPGGWIVPAATEADGQVVNGMSLSRRDSPFANSGIVVALEPEELTAGGYGDRPLGGVELQRRIEQAAFVAGGGRLRAPAQRATDFVAGRLTARLPPTSYTPGQESADLAAVLDSGGIAIAERLRQGLRDFGGRMRGYLKDEAVLLGVETRTSSPVRIVRDAESLDSPSLRALYPCGEGAGYAGGIMSAAMDGMRVARRIAAK